MNLVDLTITRLGEQGDGFALHRGEPLPVPYALPGEIVQVDLSCRPPRLAAVQEPSPERQTPPCIYFTRCGGCNLQHLAPAGYRSFKEARLARVLAQLKVDVEPEPMAFSPPASRRRVELAFLHGEGGSQVAYNQAASHQLIAISSCPLALESISALLPRLGSLARCLRRPANLQAAQLTQTHQGLDLLLTGQPLGARDLAALKQGLSQLPLARATYRSRQEGLAETLTNLGGGPVTVGEQFAIPFPPGNFLQPTAEGEVALVGFAGRHLAHAQSVVDLYCGLGTFSAPFLAAGGRVLAVEGMEEAVTSLHNAALRAGHADRLQAERVDLYRQPLPAERLRHWEAAIINPPRNGALPQVRQLAASGIPRIVMISCHPASFTRDAAHLLQSGYRLDAIQGVDQFLWGPHLEIAASFRR